MPFASLSPSALPPLALADPAPGPLGIAKRIVFLQAETTLATSQALIPQLQGSLAATLSNLAVLDAERTVFDREDTDAASAGQLAINHLSLYRSLGGGTKMPKQPVLNDKP